LWKEVPPIRAYASDLGERIIAAVDRHDGSIRSIAGGWAEALIPDEG
jgi:ABC-type phosphonate transport system ATPase subunit